MRRIILVGLVLGVSGCGAEVAGTAAVVGATKATEAEAVQKQQEQIKQRLDAVAELERRRLHDAAESK